MVRQIGRLGSNHPKEAVIQDSFKSLGHAVVFHLAEKISRIEAVCMHDAKTSKEFKKGVNFVDSTNQFPCLVLCITSIGFLGQP